MKTVKKLLACSGLVFAAAAAQAGNGLYEVEVTGLQGLNILEGTPLWQPAPLYPSMALRRGLEGEVLVEYDISPRGKAEGIRIVESSPRGFFNNATVRALENSSFGVSYEEGVAVAIEGVKKRFIYKIEETGPDSSRPVVAVN